MATNWKTSLAGIAAGALNLFAQGLTWKQVLGSAGIAVLGYLAGDANKPQESKPESK